MSGDRPVAVRVAALRKIKQEFPGTEIILVGDRAKIKKELGDECGRFAIENAKDVVRMDEPPARAIRRRDTSIRRALKLVAEGRAQAAVSAGNTGALMGLGVLELKLIEGITRPAIASFIPCRSAGHSFCLLDLGANVGSTPRMLREFALMGTSLVQAVKKVKRPTVGLLNIGEEAFKGGETLSQAMALMEEDSHLNFIGNIEGNDIFQGKAEVVVCDGFTGNVVLKATEGLASMILRMIEQAFQENRFSRGCGFFALPVLRKLKRRMDSRAYNGACFLGLRGVVVKSHGNADEVAFAAAIRYSIRAAEQNLPAAIAESLPDLPDKAGDEATPEVLAKVS